MAEVESRFNDGENITVPPDSGQILALVDALHAGTLNDAQRETVQALRAGILAIAKGASWFPGNRCYSVRTQGKAELDVQVVVHDISFALPKLPPQPEA